MESSRMTPARLDELKRNGYVVIPNVVSLERISAIRDSVNRFYETKHVGYVEGDISTRGLLDPSTRGLRSDPHLIEYWNLRTDMEIIKIFMTLHRVSHPRDLRVSFDRTLKVAARSTRAISGTFHEVLNNTEHHNVHVDAGRTCLLDWSHMSVQGSICLTDNRGLDARGKNKGGFVVFPGGHLIHNEIVKLAQNNDDWIQLKPADINMLRTAHGLAQPELVELGPGDMVLWLSQLPHMGAVPMFSERMMMYLCYKPVTGVPKDKLAKWDARRVELFEQNRTTSHNPFPPKQLPNPRTYGKPMAHRAPLAVYKHFLMSPESLCAIGRALVGYPLVSHVPISSLRPVSSLAKRKQEDFEDESVPKRIEQSK